MADGLAFPSARRGLARGVYRVPCPARGGSVILFAVNSDGERIRTTGEIYPEEVPAAHRRLLAFLARSDPPPGTRAVA